MLITTIFFFFQAEDGIRDLVRSRGLGDVYKRQRLDILKLADAEVIPVLSTSSVSASSVPSSTCFNSRRDRGESIERVAYRRGLKHDSSPKDTMPHSVFK
eukprot:TRINITY_DN5296_c0_g1_i1.p2 TRINITY_DN5296_c0_g1~~TRINITY_DN5296_c0_g1_i1.p2  ORF type:complete len:100 (+),score=20.95 TRINITY_DN5296_c0_g1_i1:12-311(+)